MRFSRTTASALLLAAFPLPSSPSPPRKSPSLRPTGTAGAPSTTPRCPTTASGPPTLSNLRSVTANSSSAPPPAPPN